MGFRAGVVLGGWWARIGGECNDASRDRPTTTKRIMSADQANQQYVMEGTSVQGICTALGQGI